jgi:hypothetical protein
MRGISVTAGIFLALHCTTEATAQSKYDIVWLGDVITQGSTLQAYDAIIINRQTNKANSCRATVTVTLAPPKYTYTMTASCSATDSDYRSNLPRGANIESKVTRQPPAKPSPLLLIWQVDTDTGAGEVCSLEINVFGPGNGCTTFNLE